MGSIAQEDFVLIDAWPGVPNSQAPVVPNGFDSTQAGNRATSGSPVYPCGTKIQAFQDATVGAGGSNVANKGYYTMMYMRYLDYTGGDDCSFGAVTTVACASAKALGELGCSKDISGGNDVSLGGPCAIACTSVGDTQYGWFWVGGVCPNYDITRMDDATGFLTDGAIVQGANLSCGGAADSSEAVIGAVLVDASGTHVITGRAYSDDT